MIAIRPDSETARRSGERRGARPGRRGPALLAAAALPMWSMAGLACGPSVQRPPVIVTEQPVTPEPTPETAPVPDTPASKRRDVRPEKEPLIVAAWTEPPHLPPGGGQAQILIRVQRRGGSPATGVDVRVETTEGRLYSQGRILTTDQNGRTRDRITTRRTARIEINAGGTRYSILVPVLPKQAQPE